MFGDGTIMFDDNPSLENLTRYEDNVPDQSERLFQVESPNVFLRLLYPGYTPLDEREPESKHAINMQLLYESYQQEDELESLEALCSLDLGDFHDLRSSNEEQFSNLKNVLMDVVNQAEQYYQMTLGNNAIDELETTDYSVGSETLINRAHQSFETMMDGLIRMDLDDFMAVHQGESTVMDFASEPDRPDPASSDEQTQHSTTGASGNPEGDSEQPAENKSNSSGGSGDGSEKESTDRDDEENDDDSEQSQSDSEQPVF